jgi:hypothetical protein
MLHAFSLQAQTSIMSFRPQVPAIGTVDGRLSVRIPVRPGTDPTAVLVDVVAALCGGRNAPASVTDGSVRLKVRPETLVQDFRQHETPIQGVQTPSDCEIN